MLLLSIKQGRSLLFVWVCAVWLSPHQSATGQALPTSKSSGKPSSKNASLCLGSFCGRVQQDASRMLSFGLKCKPKMTFLHCHFTMRNVLSCLLHNRPLQSRSCTVFLLLCLELCECRVSSCRHRCLIGADQEHHSELLLKSSCRLGLHNFASQCTYCTLRICMTVCHALCDRTPRKNPPDLHVRPAWALAHGNVQHSRHAL